MDLASQRGIGDLNEIVDSLPSRQQRLFQRIFRVSAATGVLRAPEEMRPWIVNNVGSLESVQNQKIVRVTNLVTQEETLFNNLRSKRPLKGTKQVDIESEIAQGKGDSLCNPFTETPEDAFGRVKGNYCVTGSNLAKYDGFHGLVIFDEHHPLHFDGERVSDYLDTGLRWAEEAYALDPAAKYYFFMWNCLWRAGASLVHGHAQIMVGRDVHYAKIEGLRRSALVYRSQYGTNYFHDLYQIHVSVGCAFEKEKTKVIAYLTPLKEKEVMVISDQLDPAFKKNLYEVLAAFRDELAVTSFNLALYMPPLGDSEENWEGFPIIARIVDRGSLNNRNSDIGAMELYAASVVSSDPFNLIKVLKGYMGA
ncbi:MAG: hypothetical protein HY664_00730 [Chloroflexi bacterium]|nr:hypothetical protein [Chloroflexota bacterium]